MHLRSGSTLLLAALCAAGCHDHASDKSVAAAAAGRHLSAVRAGRHLSAVSAGGPASSSPVPAPLSSGSAAAAAAPPASAAAARLAAKGTAKAAQPLSSPDVKLLSSGSAPRRALRYHFKKGQVEKFKLTSATSMGIHIAGHAMPAPAIPTLEMTAKIKITWVGPDGSAKRDLSIQKVQVADPDQVPSAVKKSIQSSLGEMAKLKGHDEVDARGRLISSKLDTSALDDGQVKQMMQAMATAFGEVSAPFPSQPVGKGARWQVESHVTQMGMKMKQLATYTLEKQDGDHGTMSMKLTQSAPGSRIQIPGVPLDVHSDLLGMTGSGSGQIQFDLGRSLPAGHMTTQSDVKVRTEMRGRSQDTQMDMSLTETFEPL